MNPLARVLLLAAAFLPISAQVIATSADQRITMGHLHLNARDMEAHRRFWQGALQGKASRFGPQDAYLFPGAVILVRKSAEVAGGTEGSVVNHVGLKVRSLTATLDRCRKAGITIVSSNPRQAMLLGPDQIRVELSEDTALAGPAANHHIHFYTEDTGETRDWYAKTFGATPGQRGPFDAADLPGVNLTFSKSETRLTGTKGRVLDHIGFEVKDLEAFAAKLDASGIRFDVPYRKIPELGIAVAFFTDPWGTYIELTEGLGQIQ